MAFRLVVAAVEERPALPAAGVGVAVVEDVGVVAGVAEHAAADEGEGIEIGHGKRARRQQRLERGRGGFHRSLPSSI